MTSALIARTLDRSALSKVAAVLGLELALVVLFRGGFFELLLSGALAMPILYALTRRPQLGIVALVACLPLDGLLLLVPHPFIVEGWKEELVIATAAATFVAPLSARAAVVLGPSAHRRRLPQWLLAAAGLFATCLVSLMLHPGLAGIYDIKIGFLFALAMFAMWRCPLDARERDRLVSVLMLGVVVSSLYGMAQQFIGPETLHAWGYEYNTTIRFNGSIMRSFATFTSPFEYGYFLTAGVLICLPVVLADTTRLRNTLFVYALPVVAMGLLASGIRGAWLGTAAGIVYIGFRRHRRLLLVIPGGLVALALLPIVVPSVSTAALSAKSSGERATNWAENISEIAAHPIGVGVGSASAAASKAQELQGRRIDIYEPDNNYFFYAYELGVVGLWWYLLMIWYAQRESRSAVRRLSGQDAALAEGVGAFVIASVVLSGIAVWFSTYPSNQLWWVMFGVLATAPSARPREVGAEFVGAAQ